VTASVQDSPRLPPDLRPAFLPLHKRAFGMAVGLALGGLLCGITVVHLVRQPDREFPLSLLGEYFAGYTVSWEGALLGLAWGFVTGFVGGWFLAFTRNVVLASIIFVTRTRAEMAATRDFLDHI
jgi:hypothetical protein